MPCVTKMSRSTHTSSQLTTLPGSGLFPFLNSALLHGGFIATLQVGELQPCILPGSSTKPKRNFSTNTESKIPEPILGPMNEARETEHANQPGPRPCSLPEPGKTKVNSTQTTWAESWSKMGPQMEIQMFFTKNSKKYPRP